MPCQNASGMLVSGTQGVILDDNNPPALDFHSDHNRAFKVAQNVETHDLAHWSEAEIDVFKINY